ncbi:MAG: hypothetical protein KKE94_15695 [Gammaproteobacteria bacterium]|nr:hypothetical protein [Gammaproteobacteria bacterium]
MLSCVDKSAWKLDDKAWVKARKAQWAELSKKLKARDKTTLPLLESRTTNYWKSYFLSGELASTEHMVSLIGLEISPFYILWFHPDQSEANLRQLLLRLIEIFEIGGWDVRIDMAKYGQEILRRCSGLTNNPLLGEEGVFGGKERHYLRLLFGTKEDGFISSERFSPLEHDFFRLYGGYLLSPDADPNWPELELVEFYLTTASRYEKPRKEVHLWRQRFTLQLFYYFDVIRTQLRQDHQWQINAQELVSKFKTAFEQNQLNDYLHQEWQFVTRELKNQLIPNEQLLYENLYPIYERVMKSIA